MIKIATTGDTIQTENKVYMLLHIYLLYIIYIIIIIIIIISHIRLRFSDAARLRESPNRSYKERTLISASAVSHRRESGWVDGWVGRGTDQGGPEVERVRDL